MTKTISIALGETRISFACDHCRTIVTVSVADPQSGSEAGYVNRKRECPVCGYEFNDSIFHAFDSYLDWLRKAQDANAMFEYVIDAPEK